MARFEELTKGAQVNGARTDGPVEALDAKWHGGSALERTPCGGKGRAPDATSNNGRITQWRELTRLADQAPVTGQRDLHGGGEGA